MFQRAKEESFFERAPIVHFMPRGASMQTLTIHTGDIRLCTHIIDRQLDTQTPTAVW